MCDTMLKTSAGRTAAACFDPLDDLDMVDDFIDILGPTSAPVDGAPCRKRDRGESFDFLLLLGDESCKKTRVEDDIQALMDFRLEDDEGTLQFLSECPALMDTASASAVDDMDLSLFGDDGAIGSATPPRVLGRSISTSTPPLSPREEFTTESSSSWLSDPAPVLSMMSSRTASCMSVLSGDLLDLDLIPDRVEEDNLVNMPAHMAFCGDSRITRPTRTIAVENCLLPMPSPAWFDSFQPEEKLPAIATKRVCVEERSLSTEQKEKHAQWIQRRRKCLTGHKGYKCPAKSRAAKNKVRNNGRFDQKLKK